MSCRTPRDELGERGKGYSFMGLESGALRRLGVRGLESELEDLFFWSFQLVDSAQNIIYRS